MGLKSFFQRFMRDDRGQSTTEYILILSVVVLIAMKFKTQISARIEGLVGKVGDQMNSFNTE